MLYMAYSGFLENDLGQNMPPILGEASVNINIEIPIDMQRERWKLLCIALPKKLI